MLDRPRTMTRRIVGMMMLIPGLLHVPLPQADFHVIRHHHGPGQTCPYHEHLLRWHPLAGEAEDVAVFHWHWLLPQSLDAVASDPSPRLHAHVVDTLEPHWDADQAAVSPEDGVRAPGSLDLASWLDLALIGCARGEPLQAFPDAWAGPGVQAGASTGTSPAQLVRWNC